MIRSTAGALLLLLVATTACDGADEMATTFSVDTLASGTIVVRNAPREEGGEGTIRLEREVRIGAVDGAEPFVFGQVRDVAIGPDGLVYVLDGIAEEVRVFSADGQHVRTMGGPGDGPGELRGPFAIALDPEGRLWIAQERGRRYTVFDAAGSFVDSPQRPFRWPVSTGVLRFTRDGALHEHGWNGSANPGVRIRMTADSVVTIRDSLALPAWTSAAWTRPVGERIGMQVPFTPRMVADVGPDGSVWTAMGDSYRLVQRGPGGDTLRVVEMAVPPTPLSDAERAAADDSADVAAGRGFEVDRSQIPAAHPYFTDLVVASDGHLWLRRRVESGPPGDDGGHAEAYDVFAPDGRYAGRVPVAGMDSWPSPYITGTHIAGVSRDSLDVPYVEVYRIVWPER